MRRLKNVIVGKINYYMGTPGDVNVIKQAKAISLPDISLNILNSLSDRHMTKLRGKIN